MFNARIVFLKATVKKQVYIPAYTRHDGVVVLGHYALVHVTADHDEHKILAGQGSYSQKVAHAQLTQHDWFNDLPHDHKVPVLLKHATDIQDKESAAATLSKFKKKILAGQQPSHAECKAFSLLDAAKHEVFVKQAKEAGQWLFLQNVLIAWKVKQPSVLTDVDQTQADKAAADLKIKTAAMLDKINAAKLPESNSNHKSVNAKLSLIHTAVSIGDVQGLLNMGFGTNTYAQHTVKLVNEALAVLESTETVAAGQKPEEPQTKSKSTTLPPKLVGATAVSSPTFAHKEVGPKDGDTKPGANGDTLVFKDGRWHKQAVSSTDAVSEVKNTATPVIKDQLTNTQPGHHKFWSASVEGNNLVVHYGKIGTTGAQSIKPFGSPTEAQEAKAKLIQQKLAKGYKQQGGTTPPTMASPSTIKEGQLSVMPADDWVQIGPQKGSNPGGKFEDSKGVEWYCKFPDNPDVVKNELLASKFYEMLGAKVPTLRLVKKDGKLGIASRWKEGLSKGTPAQLAKASGVHGAFIFDAWLANWDVVGMTHDNLLLDGKHAVRIDVGGSLGYRAMGNKKGNDFGHTVPELHSLLNPAINSKTAAVFAGISPESLQQGVQTLAKMRDGQIKKLVELFGPGNAAEKDTLAQTLIARRLFILNTLKVADPWNQPAPDMTVLKVNPADLPTPIDFANYKGSGNGLSSKALINQQNTIDDAALIAFAKKGNLTALKHYQYAAFDKETGNSLGNKPITDHPNKDIKEHWAYLVELLDSIAHPSIVGLDMPPLNAGTLAEIADAAGFIPFGQRVATISPEKRLGFWMKVAHAGNDVTDLIPKSTHWVSDTMKKASKMAWSKIGSVTKAFIAEVQASGWINHVFSEGKTHVNAKGNGGEYTGGVGGLAAAAYQDAIELGEGTRLTRWMQMPQVMMDQLLKEKPGLIFQNTDSMCTSMDPSWGKFSHFGNGALLNIVYGKGAKALHSFATGKYSNEQEITTLMGQRFVLLKASKGNPSNPDGITLDLLMLPPHAGFIADIEHHAKLGKSFVLIVKRLWKAWKGLM